MQTFGSPASVVAAIREEAEAEVERIEEATASALSSLREEAASTSVAIEDREERLAAARRTNEERVAMQEWEGRRAAIEQREAWIGRVVAKAQERWRCTPAQRDALIAEARARLPIGPCDVTDSPRGGCVVQAGNVSFDNTFEARSRRLEPEWRNALSRMYTP